MPPDPAPAAAAPAPAPAAAAPAPAAAAAAAPAPAPAAPAPAAPAVPEWLKGADEATVGLAKSKAWEGPLDAVKAYENAQKLLGVPHDQLVRLPNDTATKADLEVFYNKLGRPATPNDYTLPMPDGQKDTTLADWAKPVFHELGIPGKQAAALVGKWNEFMASMGAKQLETYNAEVAKADGALKTEWGAAYDKNVQLGRRAAETFGVSKETLDRLESQLGFADLMKFMANVGGKLGEDTFVTPDGKVTSFDVMTPGEAQARIKALQADPDWRKSYLSGNADKTAEMQRLQKFAYPD